MARRKLSVGGRVLAAGLSVGVAGALAGVMAANDHTADATQPATAPGGNGTITSPAASQARPYVPDDGNASSTPFSRQPHTRSGGS